MEKISGRMDLYIYWDKSPLKCANRLKTPTLFLYSDGDYRCWTDQAYQMFTNSS